MNSRPLHRTLRSVTAYLFLWALGWYGTPLEAQVLITEFQASNDGTIVDEDGDSSDWAEFFNAGGAAVDLGGWFLTDDAGDIRKWQFPSVTLEGGEFLLVWLSGKNRLDPSGELHSNFGLNASGEYFALVEPDGFTIAQEFSPEFPEQRPGFSFGIAQSAETTILFGADSPVSWEVPTGSGDGLDWTERTFNDSDWSFGQQAVGYDTGEGPAMGEEMNVAPDGTASQSSEFGDGRFPASLAINGRLDDFTHTASGQGPASWEVELPQDASISRVVIHNRAGCCKSRLRDITVTILDADDIEVWESELLNEENVLGGGGTNGPDRLEVDLLDLLGAPIVGRTVQVTRTPDPDLSGSGGSGNDDESHVLSLGEVEVFELPTFSFDALITTDIEADLHGRNSGAYLRIPFNIIDLELFDQLRLAVQYDDGFVAYLNGREVARRNAPASPQWSSAASAERSDSSAVNFEDVIITGDQDALEVGLNILAVHGLNRSVDDDDFLFAAELSGATIIGDAVRYFQSPTPGAPNGADGFQGFVADTTFSHDRGFYDVPIDVEITTATPGATIRYRLDGEPPTSTTGTVYSGPLRIDSTTTLRAAAFRSGMEPTNVDTHTYVFVDDVILQTSGATIAAGFPTSWGGTSPDYGMDFDVIGQNGTDDYDGRYADSIREDLKSIPTLSIVMDVDHLFSSSGIYTNSGSRGSSWERPCSAELIFGDETEAMPATKGFQVDCGIRIQGGAFRSHGLTKKHSLRLLFKSDYGPTKLRYPLFGRKDVSESFDTITLRANSNDGYQWNGAGTSPLYIRDSFGRESMLDMGQPASHETFVHVYLNGIYWGLYNPVERPDNSFSATYSGGEKEDWDAYSNSSFSNGNSQAWNTLIQMGRSGLTSNAAYFAIQGRNPDGSDNPAMEGYVDVVNCADYMITNLYVGNTDWPNKNYWAGRDRVAGTGYLFYMWDSEWSMGIRSDLNTNRIGVDNGVAEPYSHLRDNEEFRVLFGDRVHRHFFNGGTFYVDPASPQWDPANPERNRPAARMARLGEQIQHAIVAESARWGDQHMSTPLTRDEHWVPELDDLLSSYFPQRSAVVLSQFRSAGLYPDVEAPSFNQHGGFIEAGFSLVIRGNEGTVWYTLDGTDPRDIGGALNPNALEGGTAERFVLIEERGPVRVLVPTDGSLGLDWTDVDFDDQTWQVGTTGVGYEGSSGYEALIDLDVEAEMSETTASAYLRQTFDLDSTEGLAFLTLRMKFDDGFVAYLNSRPVASSRAPESLSWDSRSVGSHADSQAVDFENFDLSQHLDVLRVGTNVLAIHGLNSSPASSDFLMLPQLETGRLRNGGIVLDETTTVRARALSGGEWSALNEATFWLDTPIRITELQYHPAPPAEGSLFSEGDYEFIELQNISDRTISLEGIRLSGAVEFDFTDSAVTSLAPREVVVVIRDARGFADRYDLGGTLVAGEYAGALDNSGECLRLIGPDGEFILDFSYEDSWYPSTDGLGPSLVIDDAQEDRSTWGEADSWRPSDFAFGSPGIDESGDIPLGGLQLPGNVNQDANLDVSDAVALLGHLFTGTPAILPCGDGTINDPANLTLLDHNGDLAINLADAVSLLAYLFQGGSAPSAGTQCVRVLNCPNSCSL